MGCGKKNPYTYFSANTIVVAGITNESEHKIEIRDDKSKVTSITDQVKQRHKFWLNNVQHLKFVRRSLHLEYEYNSDASAVHYYYYCMLPLLSLYSQSSHS